MTSRVLIFGYLGHGNFGDCLLLDAALTRIADGKQVTIVTVAGKPERIAPTQNDRLNISFVASRSMAHYQSLVQAQEIYCIGGSCFIRGKSGFFINQLIAAVAGKRIVWRNVGIEASYVPSFFQRAIFRRTLHSLCVRDGASQRLAERHWSVAASVQPDAAFQLPTLQAALLPDGERVPRLVVSLKESEATLEDKLVWVEQARRRVGIALPLLVMPACPLDVPICRAVASKLGAEIVEADWLNQIDLIAQSTAFVGERLHHQIAAYTLGLEVFAIRYMEKNVTAFEGIPKDRVVFFPPQAT